MKPREFLALVVETALGALREPRPEVRLRASMAQLYFDSPDQHYEVWLRRQAGLLELGLHFEGPREENLRRIAAVAEAMPALSGQVDVEEWTETWTRLHEVWPLDTLDPDLARRVGQRLALYITTLEPVVEPLGAMPPRQRHAHGDGRWRRRRRRR